MHVFVRGVCNYMLWMRSTGILAAKDFAAARLLAVDIIPTTDDVQATFEYA